jgi:lipopolysaccharide export system protein LptC
LTALRNTTISLLLMLAAGLSIWSIIISNKHPAPTVQNDPAKADSYMEDVIATMLGKDGKPTLKLISPKMIHFPENDSTKILTPRLTIFRKSPNPWYVDADYAKTKNGISEILFWDHVVIHHPSDIENPNTSLQTQALTIFPDQQIARTDLPVTFIQPDTVVHAKGMLANLNDSTIKLLSETQGDYVPNNS